ncbi:germination lipoprotein GerS-related protein [Hathewaya histolytica]|uniref:germination lipoprotein GerS-related protein n=1 Tax=Hathewaya histolytica TaxID=1498 RepID=UPI003B66F33F
MRKTIKENIKYTIEKLKTKNIKEEIANEKEKTKYRSGNKVFRFLVIILLIIWGAFMLKLCTKKQESVFDSIQSLKNIQSYSASIEIISKNDKQELLYSGTQKYKKNVGSKLELEKNIYLYKDGKLYVKDKYNSKVFQDEKEKTDLFKITFIDECLKYLYTDKNLKSIKEKKNKEEIETLHFVLPGNNENVNSAKLIIDIKSKTPKELLILNKEHKVTTKIKYKDFINNVKIDESEFKF